MIRVNFFRILIILLLVGCAQKPELTAESFAFLPTSLSAKKSPTDKSYNSTPPKHLTYKSSSPVPSSTAHLTAAYSPTVLGDISPSTGSLSPSATRATSHLPLSTPTATRHAPNETPFDHLTINALAARAYGGGMLNIVETLERNDRFTRYLITYPSDDLTIYGYLNVPNEGSHFPVVILLHGYVPPDAYETVAYTARYADALAEAGFFVIHPNLRGYPPSDSGPDLFRTGMAIDVLNLIAIIREQSQDPFGYLRRADADNIHLWGHSMGGGVALRALTVNNDPYLRSAVLYGAMSGDEALNYGQIRQLSGGSRGGLEGSIEPRTLEAISPIYHLDRLKAAISIHHSNADAIVPVAWSEALCAELESLHHPVECFIYNGAPHTFHTVWDDAFIARTIAFFNRSNE